jgi:rhodanese-related sulfurtransferase
MDNPMEIDAKKVHDLIKSDPDTLLVCAYESEDEFRQHDLEGAISLDEFRSGEPTFSLDQQIIFYCACPHDEAALKQAKKCLGEGYKNVKVLKGGAKAWKDAGFPVLEKV